MGGEGGKAEVKSIGQRGQGHVREHGFEALGGEVGRVEVSLGRWSGITPRR